MVCELTAVFHFKNQESSNHSLTQRWCKVAILFVKWRKLIPLSSEIIVATLVVTIRLVLKTICKIGFKQCPPRSSGKYLFPATDTTTFSNTTLRQREEKLNNSFNPHHFN